MSSSLTSSSSPFDLVSFTCSTWGEALDEKKQKCYYYNKTTKERNWSVPEEYLAWKKAHKDLVDEEIASGLIDVGNDASLFWSNFDLYLRNLSIRSQDFISKRNAQAQIECARQKKMKFSLTAPFSKSWDYESFIKSFGSSNGNSSSNSISSIIEGGSILNSNKSGGGSKLSDKISSSDSLENLFSANQSKNSNSIVPLSQKEIDLENEKIERFFKENDAILERDAPTYLKRYREINSSASLDDVAKKAKSSYKGINHMSNILSDCIMLTKFLGDDERGVRRIAYAKQEDQASIAKEIHDLYKAESDKYLMTELSKVLQGQAKFDSESEKKIDLTSSDQEWLLEIMKIPEIRQSVYLLYDKNKKSRVLNKCLTLIISLGFRKEVSDFISDIEFFDILIEKLSENILKIVYSNNYDSSIALEDIKKQCYLSENSYLFAIDLLSSVEEQLSSKPFQETLMIGTNKDVQLLPKIRRIRQELETHRVWGKISENQKADFLLCAYKITSTSSAALCANVNHHTSASTALFAPSALDWLASTSDYNKVPTFRKTPREISKLYCSVHNLPEGAATCEMTIDMVDGALAFVNILQSNHVFNLFIDTLATHISENSSQFEHMSRLLSIGSVYNDHYRMVLTRLVYDNSASGRKSNEDQYRSYVSAVLLNGDAIFKMAMYCKDLKERASGAVDAASASVKLPALLKYLVPSLLALRWINSCIDDKPGFMSQPNKFTNLSQVFFQIIVIVTENFPVHHAKCFNILKKIINTFKSTAISDSDAPDASSTAATSQRVQRNSKAVEDAIECIVFLIGNGYSVLPMEFIIKEKEGMDAAALRRFTELIIRNISPPFTLDFAKRMASLFSDHSTYLRAHSIKSDPLLRKNLIRILEAISTASVASEGNATKLQELHKQLSA